MPKISTEYVTIQGRQHKYELWFNAKTNKFYANKLPAEFHEFLKEAKIHEPESTEKYKFVKEVLPAAIKQWEAAGVKERIVIAYKAKYGSKNVPASKGCDRINPLISLSYTEEAVLELEFDVYKERSINGVKNYYKRWRDWNHPVTDEPDDWQLEATDRWGFEKEYTIIDWTPEREASFVSVYLVLENLIGKFRSIIAQPDNFLKLLDSGTALLEDKSNDR